MDGNNGNHAPKRYAALLVDFENLYYFLKSNPYYKALDTMALTVELIQKLREHLETEYGENTITLDAYADFERIEDNAQSDLYLLGFATHNVLGTDHKNAADMKLAIDTMDVLYTRPEISSFVLIAGDRDYIPVIQHLKRKAKIVRVVGFQGSVSGDLLTTVGQQFFINGHQFIEKKPAPLKVPAHVAAAKLEAPTVQASKSFLPPVASPKKPEVVSKSKVIIDIPLSIAPPIPSIPIKSMEAYRAFALGLCFKYFKGKSEVWLSPFLHKFRNEAPELSEVERKSIVSALNESGVITMEIRQGEMHDYTVFKLNWNNPEVRAAAQ